MSWAEKCSPKPPFAANGSRSAVSVKALRHTNKALFQTNSATCGGRRYLLMLSPVWLFAAPAMGLGTLSCAILAKAGLHELTHDPTPDPIGNYWVILAAAMLGLSHLATMLAVAGHLYGVREGFRRPGALTVLLARRLSLETLLLAGAALLCLGLAILGYVALNWVERSFQAMYSVYYPVVGVLCLTLSGQTVFSGFLLAILAGNRAKFLDPSRSLIDHRSVTLSRSDPVGHQHAFVVLAYKDSPFLRACLASVCAQTRPSAVVIATSTPSPYIEDVAKSFGVQVKVNPLHSGIAGDWAFGLSVTDARYVTLAHQDDVYYPTFAQQTLETFERSAKAALCFTGYEEIDDEGRPKSSKISKIKHLIQFFAIGSREKSKGAPCTPCSPSGTHCLVPPSPMIAASWLGSSFRRNSRAIWIGTHG